MLVMAFFDYKPIKMIPEEKYLKYYFGHKSNYYLEIYKDYHAGNKFNVNIGAFFTSIFWWLYRKLYLHTIIIFCCYFLISFLEQSIYEIFDMEVEYQKIIYFLDSCITASILGFTGNYFYIKKATKDIQRILSSTTDENERIRMLKRKGGVSWIPFGLLGLIILFYIFQ
jgi:Protein of unknown function (DUF2628)